MTLAAAHKRLRWPVETRRTSDFYFSHHPYLRTVFDIKMTSGDSSPPGSPRPPAPRPPSPTPNCTHNCGPIEQAGVDWRHWTCRCGNGYYTPDRVWISGSDVRNGRKPPRNQQPAGDRETSAGYSK